MSEPVIIPVRDDHHPTVAADMVYERAPSGELHLSEIRLHATDGGDLGIGSLGPLPLSRWDRTARFQAATSDKEALDDIAVARVQDAHPGLGPNSHGNAKKRWLSLVGLARFAEEYCRIAATGHSNPSLLLAEHHGVSAGTVRSWLHRARREGLAPSSLHPNATVNRHRSDV